MAECKLLTDGREALAIGSAANHFRGLARNDRDICYQVDGAWSTRGTSCGSHSASC